ncbi:hypothetical protein PCASD_14795 [Puccinia coronata f. sp. avenae]|nr:hypothetical protein PCASD_14795 [Puccinia coronata f. sp. avenae]
MEFSGFFGSKGVAKAAGTSAEDAGNLARGQSSGAALRTGASDSKQLGGNQRATHPTNDLHESVGPASENSRLEKKLPPRLQRQTGRRAKKNPLTLGTLDDPSNPGLIQANSKVDANLNNKLTRTGGQRFKESSLPQSTLDDIAKENSLDAIAKNPPSRHILTHQDESSHRVQGDPIPHSIANLRADQSEEYESFSERFGTHIPELKPVNYDPIYLDVLHEDPRPIPKDAEVSKKLSDQAKRAGKILASLSADEKLRQTVDIDFMVREFKNTWLKKIHPEHQKDGKVSKGIEQVSEQFRGVLQLSKPRAQTEKAISTTMKPWKEFEKKLAQGLQDAMEVYIKDQTDKIVLSQLDDIFKNWNSPKVKETAESIAESLSKEIDYQDLKHLAQATLLTSSPRNTRLILKMLDPHEEDLKKFLIEKFKQVPQSSDEESRFIFEQFSSRTYSTLMKKNSNTQLMDLTPEEIAASTQITTESILHLKFQFSLVKPFEEAAESLVRTHVNQIANLIADDTDLMKEAYKKQLDKMIYDSNAKVEAQLFKRNYNIDLTPDQMYNKMKKLGEAWKLDLEAFERNFKSKLSPQEYKELSDASSSKLLYDDVLNSIKRTRKIDQFQYLESETFVEEHYPDHFSSVKAFVDKLSERGVIEEEFARQLLIDAKKENGATIALNKLNTIMNIEVFNKLEIRLLPQLDLSSETSSINNFLDELMTERLITTEERNYFYPTHVPKDSTPISLIEDFAKRVKELPTLPSAFRDRLAGYLNLKFEGISRDASFKSETLTKQTDYLISLQKEQINGDLRDNKYDQAFQSLHPDSIKNSVNDQLSHEYLASEFWKDYFSREYSAYKILPIDRQKEKLLNDGALKSTGITNEDALNLRERALRQLRPQATEKDPSAESKGTASKVEATSSKTQATSSKKKDDKEEIKLPDERHFALLANSLKPAEGKTAQQSLKLADERFKNTPFRYLDKNIMDEWNASVNYISKKMNSLTESIEKRNLLNTNMLKRLRAMNQYNQILDQLIHDINIKFTPIDLQSGLYKLTPDARDPRLQNSLLGP